MSGINRLVLLFKFAKLRQQNIFDSEIVQAFHVCFSLHSLIPAPSAQPTHPHLEPRLGGNLCYIFRKIKNG